MIGCLVADVKDVSELAPLLFVPQLLFAGDIPPFYYYLQPSHSPSYYYLHPSHSTSYCYLHPFHSPSYYYLDPSHSSLYPLFVTLSYCYLHPSCYIYLKYYMIIMNRDIYR